MKSPAITLAAAMREATRHLNDDRLRLLLEQLRAVGGMPMTVRAIDAELRGRKRLQTSLDSLALALALSVSSPKQNPHHS